MKPKSSMSLHFNALNVLPILYLILTKIYQHHVSVPKDSMVILIMIALHMDQVSAQKITIFQFLQGMGNLHYWQDYLAKPAVLSLIRMSKLVVIQKWNRLHALSDQYVICSWWRLQMFRLLNDQHFPWVFSIILHFRTWKSGRILIKVFWKIKICN